METLKIHHIIIALWHHIDKFKCYSSVVSHEDTALRLLTLLHQVNKTAHLKHVLLCVIIP